MEKVFSKTNKLILAIIALLVITGISSVSYAAKVSLNMKDLNLTSVGKTGILEAENASNYKSLVWRTSDAKVASVVQYSKEPTKAKVIGKNVGKAIIKFEAVASNGATITRKCTVTVGNADEISIKIENYNIYKPCFLRLDQTKQLTATIENTDYTAVTWASSDTSVVKIDKNSGKLTPVKVGKAKITVKSCANPSKKATCMVYVYENTTAVTGISLDKNSYNFDQIGNYITLKATITPSNAANKKIIWSSTDTKVAKVSNKGVVKAIGNGYATISAKTEDGGFVASCTIGVHQKVTGIKISKTKLKLCQYDQYTLKISVLPSNAANKDYEIEYDGQYSLRNKNDFFIDALNYNAGDEKTLTVKTVDGGFVAQCHITIKPARELRIKVGETKTIKPYVATSEKFKNEVTYSPAIQSYFTINNEGAVTITGKKPENLMFIMISTNKGGDFNFKARKTYNIIVTQ